MGILKAWRAALDKERKWVVVHTHDSGLQFVKDDLGKQVGTLHFELYESKYGVREVEISFTGFELRNFEVDDYAKTDVFYNTSVKPWLRGVRVTGINTYAQADQQQSIDILAGE